MQPTTIAKMATIGLTDKNISGHTFQCDDTLGFITDRAPNGGTQRYRVQKGLTERTAVIHNETTGENFTVLNFEQLINAIQLRADVTCMDMQDIADKTRDILASRIGQNHYFTSNADGTVSDTDLMVQHTGRTKTYKFSYCNQHQMLMTDDSGHQAMVHNLKDITNKIVNGM